MTNLILTANQVQIECDLNKERSYAVRFQPFVDEFLKNEYTLKDVTLIEVIQDVTYNGTLQFFFKEQALQRTPAINDLPALKESKLAMIDIGLVYSNYNTIERYYNAIRSLPPQLREKIFLFDLDNDNKLILSKSATQAIIDRHTIYANERQYKAYQKTRDVLNALISLEQDFGINMFTQNLIQRNTIGNLQGATIRAEAVNFVVSQFDRHQ